jgi:hypothetical protein
VQVGSDLERGGIETEKVVIHGAHSMQLR